MTMRVQLGPLPGTVRFGGVRLIGRLTQPTDAVFWKWPVHVHARWYQRIKQHIWLTDKSDRPLLSPLGDIMKW